MPSIIGHEHICRFLERAIANDRVAHAYLFVGSEHVGKRTVAEWFAAKLLHTEKEALHTSPDFFVVSPFTEDVDEGDRKSSAHIGIDEARELKNRLGLSSLTNTWKIALIPNAETLTIEAANALLKLLEEPHQDVCIILLARYLDSLPKTVVSRAQVVRLKRIPLEIIQNALQDIGAPQLDAAYFSKLSRGLPGVALNIYNNKDTREELARNREVFTTMLQSSLPDRLVYAKTLANPKTMQGTLDLWITFLRNQMLLYYNCKEFVLPDEHFTVSGSFSSALLRMLRAQQLLAMNVNKNLIADNVLIHLKNN